MPIHEGKNSLNSKVVICTYPPKEQDEFYEMLTRQAAKVLFMPLIKIYPMPFQTKKAIDKYHWLVFTSKNAVKPFAEKHPEVPNKIAALGEKTALHLEKYQLKPDFVGTGKSAIDFGNEFMEALEQNESILLILGSLAPDTLQQKFSSKVEVERINVYETKEVESVDPKIINLVDSNQYDAIVVTSPSAVKSLVKKVKTAKHLRMISIGKTTTAAIKDFQLEPLATSKNPSYQGLAETTIQFFKSN